MLPSKVSRNKQSACWKSLNAVLEQNQCWICNRKFVRGKTRKMFQLKQLLEYYSKTYIKYLSDGLSGSLCFDQYRKNLFVKHHYIHLNECWNRLCDLKFDNNLITIELAEFEIAPWMSSLACCNTTECDHMHAAIIAASEVYNVEKETVIRNGCLPGCGCDAPWKYLP
jgi:hypothetical protein